MIVVVEATRAAFGTGRLGLADLVLMTVPDRDTLVRRRDGDHRRRGGAASTCTSSLLARLPQA